MSATKPAPTVLRFKDLCFRTKLSRSTLRAKISAGVFPAPIALGDRAIGWIESDVDKWILSRVKAGKGTA